MDLRYFEIHDLLCDAVIALEAGDRAAVAARLARALAWIEAEWLATPATLFGAEAPRAVTPDDGDGDE